MALIRAEIQKRNDDKKGIKVKGFKLHFDDIALIEQASKDLGIPQSQLVVEAVKFYLIKNKDKLMINQNIKLKVIEKNINKPISKGDLLKFSCIFNDCSYYSNIDASVESYDEVTKTGIAKIENVYKSDKTFEKFESFISERFNFSLSNVFDKFQPF